jgi:SulP family sulfate permease
VLLDFRRVQGFDVSAAFNLDRLAQLAARNGVALGLCHLAPGAMTRLERMGLAPGCVLFPTLDDALARFEDEALAAAPEVAAAAPEAALGALIERICGPLGSDFAGRLAVPAGGVVIEQGAPSESLVLLESGRLCARVTGPDGAELRVATFLPGALAGEIGVYAGAPRSATVAAEIDSVVLAVSREALDGMAETDPHAAAEFHRLVAALLARRLTRTTALLRAIGG